MDFNLERLQDIVSPYILLLKQSKVIYVSNALAARMGIDVEDDIDDFLNKDMSVFEKFDNIQSTVHLPARASEPFCCSYTNTMLNGAELLAFTDQELSANTISEKAAPELFFDMASHSIGSLLIVEKGHILYANDNFYSLTGYEASNVLGRQIIGFISRDNRESFINICRESLEQPEQIIPMHEVILASSSGRRVHVHMNGGRVCREGREYLWLMMINIDDRVRMERLLKEQKDKFSELFDDSPIGLLYISPRGIIIDCNEFVCNIMRYTKKEIQGSPFTKFVVPHEEQQLRQEFEKLFLNGIVIPRKECMLRTEDGEDITIEYNVQAISRKGRNIKALMVFSDITEKKELEMELLEKNAEMEKTLWEMAEVKDALEARAGELNRATEELKVLNEKLNQLSITDGLTEIYNHRHFQDRLTDEVTRAGRIKEGVISMLLLDIDDFKQFNDTYGHQCGDMVLKQLAGILKSNVRNIDVLARYGGEEFAVILPDTPTDEAARVAERICESVRSTPFSFGGDTSVKVTVSIGVGSLIKGHGEKAELIRKADNALYAAKAKWKDRVEVWEED
ncbi:MAG TPA: diguanylate cyclase [Deltaproteobacteria bacterium]|nr:diguanylate cyclase [Deltaproteobacteria bacterium]